MVFRTLARTVVGVVLGLILWPVGTATALEALAVYEDWSQPLIRADRWQGGRSSAQEAKRVVTPDHTLLLRYRREGSTASNTGNTASSIFLNVANPAQVNEIEATFTVDALAMTTCGANNTGATTRARPAQILMEHFNDGTTSVAGDRTGDYLAGVQAFRDGSSADPPAVLKVVGFVQRCTNASCGTQTTIVANTLSTTVSVGQTFTLRLLWDQAGNQFLFGLDNGSDVALPYAASDSAPANNRFANVAVNHTTANCTAAAVEIDSTTRVGTVKTNSSAVIP